MDFAVQLLDQPIIRRLPDNAFVTGLQAGQFSPQALALYADRIVRFADNVLGLLARILAICPDRRVRQHILENLMEEEGFYCCDGELAGDEAKSHSALARRFVNALPPAPPDSWRNEDRQLTAWLAEECWPAAAAFFFIGFEHSVPPTIELILPALKTQYGLDDEALTFFEEHLGADQVHAARGAEMLVAACRDAQSQRLALEGARRGAMAWYRFHSVCARDMSRIDESIHA
ncbi:MAG: iron-containing redox enzyme family protein [Armatimonadota bacterium]|nr:iron-containing redox enzyme family protein [Armatimonadota bacterium]